MGEIIQFSMKKIVPCCGVCMKEMKKGQFVILDRTNAIQHAKCSRWKEDFIKDKGTYEEIVYKYPHYFEGLKV
jgi:hypothetical protein